MSKTRKICLTFLIVLISLTLGFIWSNSIKDKTGSSAQSNGVYNKVVEISTDLLGEEITDEIFSVITRDVFRKIAHFTEFALLGIESALLYICIKRIKRIAILELLAFGLTVASIDEIIQIFSNRGPSVVDVLIDFTGYLTALVIVFTLLYIVLLVKTKKKDKKQ